MFKETEESAKVILFKFLFWSNALTPIVVIEEGIVIVSILEP